MRSAEKESFEGFEIPLHEKIFVKNPLEEEEPPLKPEPQNINPRHFADHSSNDEYLGGYPFHLPDFRDRHAFADVVEFDSLGVRDAISD
jgi:hypothetical protein